MTEDLLQQPAIFFLSVVSQAGEVFAPISDRWETLAKGFLSENFPQALDFLAYLQKEPSPLSKDFPLMNPYDVALIMLGYLSMIAVSTAVMQVLPPFKLKLFSLLHNFFLTSLSLYMMVEILRQGAFDSLSLSFSMSLTLPPPPLALSFSLSLSL